MSRNSRLSRMLHMLLHIHLHDGAATSDSIALMLGTNGVVVRRLMAGLREAGYVRATRGPGGGWRLARPPSAILVHDVYVALGAPPLLASRTSADHPGCPVERSVNHALDAMTRAAEASLVERYRDTTLADMMPAPEELQRSGTQATEPARPQPSSSRKADQPGSPPQRR